MLSNVRAGGRDCWSKVATLKFKMGQYPKRATTVQLPYNPRTAKAAIPGFARRLRQRQLLIAVCDEPIAPQSRNPKRGGGATLGVPLD
jgi:hypothetical protein